MGHKESQEEVLHDQVQFSKFLNTGKGVMGRSLQPIFAWGFWVIPVELQFSVFDPAIYDKYRNLRPVNWSGSDGIWFKTGNPLLSLWQPFTWKAPQEIRAPRLQRTGFGL